jgi:hypothetical protein
MEHGLRGATNLFELICRDNPLTPPALEDLVIAVGSMKVQLLDCTGTAGVEWPWKRILRNGRVEFIRNVPVRAEKTPVA